MQKVYLVIERDSEDLLNNNVFGIFTKKEKAMEVRNELLINFAEHNETIIIKIEELILDECTEDYYYFMNN